MKVWKSMVPVLAFSLFACSSSSEGTADQGSISVALTGAASDGQTYRLRNADFEIYGYPQFPSSGMGGSVGGSGGKGGKGEGYYSELVSSETDPDAPSITRRVVAGQYYVTFLSDDWYIERLTPTGPVQVEESVLLSERTQWAYVWTGSSSDVVYRFGVDGELIDFRSGDLNIRIEIERPDDNPSGGRGGVAGMPNTGGWGTAGTATGGLLGI